MVWKRMEWKIAVLGFLLLTVLVASAHASGGTVTTGDFSIPEAGDTISIPIIMDSAPNGLSGYQITVALSDPAVAEITAVDFPTWTILEGPDGEFYYFNNSADLTLPATEVVLRAVDIEQTVPAPATDVVLATLTVRGKAVGVSSIVITPDPSLGIQDRAGDLYTIVAPEGSVTVEADAGTSVQSLYAAVEDLDLPIAVEMGLLDKLTAAGQMIQEGRDTPARQALLAFIKQVTAQKGKAIQSADADFLIAEANGILAEIA